MKYTPPPEVRTEAREGLRLRKIFNRGGTSVGLARGRQLASGKPISADIVKRMYSYFARHAVDKNGKNFDNPVKPSNGKIAWLLWGGDSAARWVYSLRKEMKNNLNTK